MKRFFPVLLIFAMLCPLGWAASTPSEVAVHPGETVYARFEVSGRKIRLVSVSKTVDAGAQVIFSLQPDTDKRTQTLRVENKFPYDLIYRAEMRSFTISRHFPAPVTPVVGGKISLDVFPREVEEIGAFDFKLEK